MDDYIELEYNDLHVEFSYGPMDWETGLGEKDFDGDIHYVYRADVDSVKEEIADLIPDEEFEEITKDAEDEDEAIYAYIDEHLDDLVTKYEKQLLEIFRDSAEEAALEDESIVPSDDDPNSYWDTDAEYYGYVEESLDNKKTLQEDKSVDIWGTDLQSKFEFLREHKTYDSKFSRDCKVWDLGLTDKQYDYFHEFMESGALELFWESNKELAKDIYQEGRMGGHLVLGDGDSYNEPIYYDSDVFKYSTLDECFENWYYIEYNVYPEVVEDEAELEEARKEFAEWLEEAYDAVVDFDERTEELIDLLKKDIDSYIETVEADDPDITSTVADELDEMVDPELEKVGYEDEIDESYFADLDEIEDDFEDGEDGVDDIDESISGSPESEEWEAIVKKFVKKAGGEVLYISDNHFGWERPDGSMVKLTARDLENILKNTKFEEDTFEEYDECIHNAEDELPELDEAVSFNPDYDDDFGDRITSYDIYRASRDLDSSDEEAFEDRDPDRYDAAHAEEWMKKHPYGWYNSESDYGIGDEDTESLNEAAMSDLALEVQSEDDIVSKLENDINKLEEERNFLINQAPKEINKGGAFDSQEEIDDALEATERALRNTRLKLKIIRGTK